MKIAISVESTCDLPKELVTQYDLKILPFNIVLGDIDFYDGEKTNEEIFALVKEKKSLPKTNAHNMFEYTEWFEKLKQDYDAVIHICISSEISSTYNNAVNASKNLENVFVVDSMNLTSSMGLLAIYGSELASKGYAPQDIVDKLNGRKDSLQTSFVIETLEYLFRGGRCSSLQLLGANVLKIRPRIVLKNGKMAMDNKYRGSMEMVVTKYCQDVLKEFNNPDLDKVFITYSTENVALVSAAEKACIDAGFKNIYKGFTGGTVSCHCGPNTLGILYFNDGGNK